ncbi:pyridoxal-phosphate dependent enzyme [Cerasibacillus sp. JNUCC 74]
MFDGTTELTSINGQTVTFQAIQAVKESNGSAIVVSDQEAQVAQKLASRRGIHLELSSAAAIAAAKKIDSSLNEEKGTIMAIATSSNFLPV